MNRKGFTLPEVLVTLLILGVILAIAVPTFGKVLENFKKSFYKQEENMLLEAGKEYFNDNKNLLPNEFLYSSIVYLKDKKLNNYLDKDLTKYRSKDSCNEETYVVVVKDKDKYIYQACLKCGDYETDTSDKINTEEDYCNIAWTENKNLYNDYKVSDKYLYYKEQYKMFSISDQNELKSLLKLHKIYEKKDNNGEKLKSIINSNDFIYPSSIDKINLSDKNKININPSYDLNYRINETTEIKSKLFLVRHTKPIISSNKEVFENSITVLNNEPIYINYNGSTLSNPYPYIFSRYEKNENNISWESACLNSSCQYKGLSPTKTKNISFRIVDTDGNVGESTINYNVHFKYTVTLDPMGGNLNRSSIEVIYNNIYGNIPIPTRIGYKFTGWYTADGVKIDSTSIVTITSPQTLYAHWEAYTSTITYNVNGGSVSDNSYGLSSYNSIVIKNQIPIVLRLKYNEFISSDGLLNPDNNSYLYLTKLGYEIVDGVEWCTNSDGTGKCYSDTNNTYNGKDFCDSSYSNCSVILYAHWQDNTKPTCTLSLRGSKGESDWYNGDVTISFASKSSDVVSYGITTSTTPTYNFANGIQTTDTSYTTWYGYVEDNTGNTNYCEIPVKLDKTAPTETTIEFKLNDSNGKDYTLNTWTNQNVYRKFSASDDTSGIKYFEYSNGCTGIKHGDEGVDINSQTINWEGENTSCHRAVDYAGNVGPWSNVNTVLIDKTEPTKTKVDFKYNDSNGKTYPLNTWTNKSVYRKFNAIDVKKTANRISGIKYFEYSNGCTGVQDDNEGVNVTSHTLVFDTNNHACHRAVDYAGNVGPWSDENIVLIDKTAPLISINNGPLSKSCGGSKGVSTKYTVKDEGSKLMSVKDYYGQKTNENDFINYGITRPETLGQTKYEYTDTWSSNCTQKNIPNDSICYNLKIQAIDQAGNKTVLVSPNCSKIGN